MLLCFIQFPTVCVCVCVCIKEIIFTVHVVFVNNSFYSPFDVIFYVGGDDIAYLLLSKYSILIVSLKLKMLYNHILLLNLSFFIYSPK